MNNKKLTDNEIIKALEYCGIRKSCGSRPLYKGHSGKCICTLLRSVLDFIIRQQTENENLKVENQSLRTAANSLKMHYEEAQAEIERLKRCVKTEEEVREIAKKTMEPLVKEITREQIDIAVKYAKAEAYKELAERLKEYMDIGHLRPPTEICFSELMVAKLIDNLVKEMVGESNSDE